MYKSSNYFDSPIYLPTVDSKKTDIIAVILEKIVGALLKAVPTILGKLFGKGLYELVNFNDEYEYGSYGNNYNQGVYDSTSDLKKLFRHLGFLGFIPMIFLKIIDGFTTFIYILKKNKFFRYFLIPALVLLVIAGAVVFLIWWLQYDYYGYSAGTYKSISNYNEPNQYSPQTYNEPNQYSTNTNGHYDIPYKNAIDSKNTNGYFDYQKYKPQQNYDKYRNRYIPRSYSRSYFAS